jgi:hypothetical protein
LTGRRWLSNWGSNRKKLEAQSKVLPYHEVNFCFDGEALLATIIQVTTLAPAREKVRKMFEVYRPGLGNGNGDEKRQRTVEVQAEPVKKPEPITSSGETESAEDAAIQESVWRERPRRR